MTKIRILLLLLTLPILTQAQVLTQHIRGRITDADSGLPLAGATVFIRQLERGTDTDSAGYFMLERVPVGRYDITISYVGYESIYVPELLIETGKEPYLSFSMATSLTEMGAVVVRATRSDMLTQPPTSIAVLTNEETRRFPAAFFDPARVAMAQAGAAGINDQANGVSVRGNSPNGMVWRLEGVDIVNPNHTPNAGTFSDRVSAFGGGVNILSAQLLGNTHFLSGAFPADYGNALSGVMDMRLRPGNSQRHEFTVQAGLIGIDVAAEGPLSRNTNSAYLLNYRYSTIGLLSAMGLQLGDEDIRFQDISFHLSLPGKGKTSWTLFGLGGNSINLFAASRDPQDWIYQKDRYDIRFRSSMGAAGITRTQTLGQRGLWHTVLAASAMSSLREADRLDDQLKAIPEEKDDYGQSRLSLHSVLKYKLSGAHRIRAGLFLSGLGYDLHSLTRGNTDTIASGQGGGSLWQPYVVWTSMLAPKWQLNAGMHAMYVAWNGSGNAEPRVSLQWMASERNRFSLAYGHHSQLQQPQLYFARLGGADNSNLGLTKARHWVAGWYRRLGEALQLQVETYYQQLYDVPVAPEGEGSFSALNLAEGFTEAELVNSGTGRNYGIELALRQFVRKDWWWMYNTSWYHSRYTGADGVERSTRFDGRFVMNGALGKEWRKERKAGRQSRVWGLSSRMVWAGGFRDTPIAAFQSAESGTTKYISEEAFSVQLPNYFRVDLRAYLQRNRQGRNTMLALDIQNLSNHKNVAYSYFDQQQSRTLIRYQLGIIPVLSYRLQFN